MRSLCLCSLLCLIILPTTKTIWHTHSIIVVTGFLIPAIAPVHHHCCCQGLLQDAPLLLASRPPLRQSSIHTCTSTTSTSHDHPLANTFTSLIPNSRQPPPLLQWRHASQADIPAIQEMIANVLKEHDLPLEVTDNDWGEIGLAGRRTRDCSTNHDNQDGGSYLSFDLLVLVDDDGHADHDQDEDEDNDDRIVGSVGIYRLNNTTDVCELRKMYLDRAFRGQGWRLLRRGIRRAEACSGCRFLVLELNEKFTRAERLYRAFGFVPYNNPNLKFGSDKALYRNLTSNATTSG